LVAKRDRERHQPTKGMTHEVDRTTCLSSNRLHDVLGRSGVPLIAVIVLHRDERWKVPIRLAPA
jgi:hypothetical protein